MKLHFQTILLFDSSSNVDELKKFLVDQTTKVITFDYESHVLLLKEKIEHEISDNYITDSDLQLIQKESYRLTEWFDDPSLKELIEYENVNLGKLLHVEFTYFLIKFLKRFFEFIQISNKYGNLKYVASPSLYDMAHSVYPQTIRLMGIEKFQYDSIKINSKIAKRSFTVSIPRSYYVFLKETFEKITNLFFAPDQSNNKKTILFVEFDVIRFRQIFSLIPQFQLNSILFNRRRPSIWNWKSFSILKNSGCRIITSGILFNSQTNNFISSEILKFETNIDRLFNLNFFHQFFVINDQSFWHIIKPTLVDLFKKRVPEYIKEIVLTKYLLQKHRLSSIVVWSEVGITEQIIVKLAQTFKIPTVLIQHGIFYDTPESFLMNKFQGVFPLEVDNYVVWGELEAKNAMRYGVSPEKIKPLGSPQYDPFVGMSRSKQHDFILIATSGFNKEESRGITVKIHEQYREILKKICDISSKFGKKVVIKLHPSPDEIEIVELKKEIGSNVAIIKSGSITPLIRSCFLMIMIDLSSVVIEANLLKKPVISIPVKDWWGTPSIFRSKGCLRILPDELESILSKVISDENFYQTLIDNGQEFTAKYMSNQGNASKKILTLLSEL